MGNLLITLGVVLVIIGLTANFLPKLPLLPGDILVRRENFTIYFPLASSILISIILTIVFTLFK